MAAYLFLGDSNTYSVEVGREQYPEALPDYAPAHTTMNEGVGGENSTEGAAGLAAILAGLPEAPTETFILYGANDAGDGLSVATFMANIATIRSDVLTAHPTCNIWVLTYFMFTGGYATYNSTMAGYNQAIRDVYGPLGELIDVQPFVNPTLGLFDTIHTNPFGSDQVARAVDAAMRGRIGPLRVSNTTGTVSANWASIGTNGAGPIVINNATGVITANGVAIGSGAAGPIVIDNRVGSISANGTKIMGF